MPSPDPESFGLLEKMVAAAAAIVVPAMAARNWLEKKFERKVGKDDFADFCKRFDQHCRDDRETQAKLFDRIDDLKTTILERMK
jgi:hypothetical protein